MFPGDQKRLEKKLKDSYGTDPTKESWHHMREERLRYIRMYHESREESPVDDITWNDLEMDQVFLRINHTRSYAGEQVLYHRLHDTDSRRDWEDFEKKVAFFDESEKQRIQIEKRLCGIGKAQSCYYLPVLLPYAASCSIPGARLFRVLQLLLLVMLAGSIILKSLPCMTGLIIVAAVNVLISMFEKAKLEEMLTCFQNLCVLLKFCEFVEKAKELPKDLVSPKLRADIKALKKLARMTGSFSANKTMAQNDPQALLMDYVLGVTLWDLTNFNQIIQIIKGQEEAIQRLFEFAGEIDLYISVASYRRSTGKFCIPDFEEAISDQEPSSRGITPEEHGLKMYGIRHPLLKDFVENDAVLGRYTMITGANASGKSTFMKAVAVNVLLAQTIHTCCAKSAVLPQVTIMTSMALRDDVVAGESYYVREVKYLKRMLDCIDSGKMVLCVIDEILKGTNTMERMAASEAVLSYLKDRPCYTLVATHDLRTARKMQKFYECFYFQSILTEQGVTFDYRLRKGMGDGTNAIALLGHYQFPESILIQAKSIMEEIKDENQ